MTLTLLLLLAAHPLTADATVFEALSLDRLTGASSQVVTARCLEIDSRRDESRDTIVTRAVFKVDRTTVGDRSLETVSVVLPGGSVDGESVLVLGAPELEVGDEVVLMLRHLPPEARELPFDVDFRLVGLSQGVFRVVRNTVTGEGWAVSGAVPFFEPGGAERTRLPGGEEGLPLVELEAAIARIATVLRIRGDEPALRRKEPDDDGEEAAGAGDEPVSSGSDEPSVRVPEAQETEGQEEGGEGGPDEP